MRIEIFLRVKNINLTRQKLRVMWVRPILLSLIWLQLVRTVFVLKHEETVAQTWGI